MSKSRNNAVMLRSTEDETAALIRKAKTDTDRHITYDPQARPEVANLLLLTSLCTGVAPDAIASRIGDAGSGALKKMLTEALNAMLAPMRARRRELARDPDVVADTLRKGIAEANAVADRTLRQTRAAMNMGYGLDDTAF
jgi:tryptophanyl-tRNA synthetase